MKRLLHRGLIGILLGFAIADLATRFEAHSRKDELGGLRMYQKTKTVCVGRFLIDLPGDAEVAIRGGSVGGFDISTAHESTEQFKTRVNSAEAEIGVLRNEQGRPSLEWNKALALDSAEGKVMVFNRERSRMPVQARMVDSEDFSVRGLLRFPNVSVVADAKRQGFERGEELARLFERLRPLEEGEIPHESGFCFGPTIVRDPYENSDTEAVVMFVGLPRHPDVNIVFSSMAGTDPAPGLIERNAKAADSEPLFMRLAITTLLERQRTLNGLHGEELGLRVREANFTTGYSFQWQMSGEQENRFAPLLSLELESGTNPISGGKPVQSTLSEEAMLDLWERITSSIRLRSTEHVQTAAKEQSTASLGTSAVANDICPQTGWWLCDDRGVRMGVLAGERQFLKAGSRMSRALLLL
ncbi:T6SS immunity protein Tli4 family protein [Massilia sp.]|uniref:T6SS immunity protein Tli4 family protein n=1 Tax=Massilia sp. TaxID=1882437 RepID=UPI0039189A6F